MLRLATLLRSPTRSSFHWSFHHASKSARCLITSSAYQLSTGSQATRAHAANLLLPAVEAAIHYSRRVIYHLRFASVAMALSSQGRTRYAANALSNFSTLIGISSE